MFKIKKIRETSIIQLVINASVTTRDIEDFISDVQESDTKDDFQLLLVLANFSNEEELQKAVTVINQEVRFLERLTKMAMITDRKNIKIILNSTQNSLPVLPFEVYEMEEEQNALKWLRKVD